MAKYIPNPNTTSRLNVKASLWNFTLVLGTFGRTCAFPPQELKVNILNVVGGTLFDSSLEVFIEV